jgi:hypothetical protein
MASENSPFEPAAVTKELEPSLRLYRRLWLSRVDLEEARATIDELLQLNLPLPKKDRPSPLLMALTTALVVSYSRPFVNSRGQSAVAEKTVPGSLLRVLSSNQRAFHNYLIDVRNREVAHSDAEAMELSLKLYADGDSAVLRISREPLRKKELQALRRMVVKLEGEIERRCIELRQVLPISVWV